MNREIHVLARGLTAGHSQQHRAAGCSKELTLAEARHLLRCAHPQEWDVLEACCDGDPYARCPRDLAAALAELDCAPVGTVHTRLARARGRILAWTGDRRAAP